MRIATWNINSIKQRMDNLTAWLSERQPDMVCLQETKCVDDAFPREPLEALGYNVAVHGQKTFNGVALLSKLPFDEVTPRLPGDEADTMPGFWRRWSRPAAAHCASHPSICPTAIRRTRTNTHTRSTGWIDLFTTHMNGSRWRSRLSLRVISTSSRRELDARNPTRWSGDALFLPRTRQKFRALCNLGLTDAVRAGSDGPGPFTFWDYQAGAWQKNDGIRIDHLLLSPQAADRLIGAGIDKHVRGWEKPSDHVPVWAESRTQFA